MNKNKVRSLSGWEKEISLWVEQESSIMVKAVSLETDPVELTSQDARNFAKLLNEAADELDRLNELKR
jgi:hypothetical protein